MFFEVMLYFYNRHLNQLIETNWEFYIEDRLRNA